MLNGFSAVANYFYHTPMKESGLKILHGKTTIKYSTRIRLCPGCANVIMATNNTDAMARPIPPTPKTLINPLTINMAHVGFGARVAENNLTFEQHFLFQSRLYILLIVINPRTVWAPLKSFEGVLTTFYHDGSSGSPDVNVGSPSHSRG